MDEKTVKEGESIAEVFGSDIVEIEKGKKKKAEKTGNCSEIPNNSKLNIFQKMLKVQEIIGSVEKSTTVSVGNNKGYQAISYDELAYRVNQAEQSVGLYSYFLSEIIENKTVPIIRFNKYTNNQEESLQYEVFIKSTLRIINTENPSEIVEVCGYGRGLDPQDKDCGKGNTYANKIALLNAYKIPKGNDLDVTASVEQVPVMTDEMKKNWGIDYYKTTNSMQKANYEAKFGKSSADFTDADYVEIYNIKHPVEK